ncbi:TetR/AcrR family transcriptional regulator C-terminal domain-containing protein [Arthrobacter sp. LAPM80]|uniref:TetR/AcrR family transcriptional regulator C-terminal domain-containing protein n=1 Tax=Arthrobacter sp. LAPM80 TaxID=3141788 RepID=UPI00398AB589
MALTRELIVGTAMGILREYGLGDLTMRRLARDLGVQPGALYWHVKNKQELLTILAGMILEPVEKTAEVGIRSLALQVRSALLAVRDGAEVVALAHALTPETPSPLLRFAPLLAARGLAPRDAVWAAGALVHYVLGAVTQEQTRAGFIGAGLLADNTADTDAAFSFGLELFLAGLPAEG